MNGRIMEGTFHRRELQSPAIAFSSKDGTSIFREALLEGHMENYFFLSEQFTTQAHPAYCGIGSLTMALNALLVDPGRVWQGVWRWFDDDMLDCCEPLETVKQKGITLHKLASLGRHNGACVKVRYGPDMTIDVFRSILSKSCARSSDINTVLIASYSRSVLNQTGIGHFSPIGGYHAGKDMVLIMDVARFKYPPHWVPVALLFEAFQGLDVDSGKPRGLLEVSAAPKGILHTRMIDCCCSVETLKDTDVCKKLIVEAGENEMKLTVASSAVEELKDFPPHPKCDSSRCSNFHETSLCFVSA